MAVNSSRGNNIVRMIRKPIIVFGEIENGKCIFIHYTAYWILIFALDRYFRFKRETPFKQSGIYDGKLTLSINVAI